MFKIPVLVMLICIGSACTLLLAGCAPFRGKKIVEYKQSRPYLGAYVMIRCFYPTGKDISSSIKACWERMDQIQSRMNAYSKSGDVAKINNSGPNGATVHDDMYSLLEKCIGYSRFTNGAFDVTVFPLVELWKNAGKKGALPEKYALETALNKVGYKNLRLQPPDRVILAKKGMKIDLGAIVSGYACDELAGILDKGGIKNFLIDTGGEIYCRGKEAGRKPWRIGIQDPQNKSKILMAINIRNKCISTSGNYEKFYLIGKKRYSHIINPAIGYPEMEAISATVIAKTGAQADALSTALCVLGGAKGIKLLSSINNVDALVIENRDGKAIKYATPRFKSSL